MSRTPASRSFRGSGSMPHSGIPGPPTQEPLPPDHPFLGLDHVIATPHVAGATRGTSRRRGAIVAENIGRAARGLPPLYEILADV